MDSLGTAPELLGYLRTGYPIFLFVVFVVSFVSNSVLSARCAQDAKNGVCTGPGGRPLPKRARSTGAVLRLPQRFSPNTRLVFKWLSVGVLFTFVADAAIHITHVILRRSQHWWPGQAVVVGRMCFCVLKQEKL